MLMWMGLLIAQPLLMRAGRRDWHRALGKATYLLMPLIFIASVLLAHFRQSQPGYLDQPGNLETLVLQIGSPLLAAGFFVMGLANRRAPAVHARWMLSTAILLIDPIVARVVVFRFPAHAASAEWLGPSLAVGLTLGLMFAERKAASGRQVFPIVLVGLLVQVVSYYILGQSDAWRRFALWFIALPLT